MIHFITYSSHRDIQAACGISAFGWEMPDDPEGTVGGDSDGARVYFCKENEEARVDCPGCKPKAEEKVARREKHETDVAAAGGYEKWKAGVDARIDAMLARKKAGGRVA